MNPTRALMDGVLKYKTLFGEVPDQRNHFLYADQAPLLDFVTAGRGFPPSLAPGKPRKRVPFHRVSHHGLGRRHRLLPERHRRRIQAGFIHVDKIERWAGTKTLTDTQSTHLGELIEAIRRGRVESTMGKKIGRFIGAAELTVTGGPDAFLSDLTARHRHRLVLDPEVEEECALYKQIALDLVFRSQQLQQLDRKSDYILSRLFGVFAELYIVPDKPGRGHYRLLSDEEEALVFSQPDEAARARVVCDVLAKMTDGIASRTYRRLFDADFGSIVDLV